MRSRRETSSSSITALETPLELRQHRSGDEASILELFAATFDKPRTLESWRWQFASAPEGPAIIHLAEADGVIAGHVAHMPFALWVDGQRLRQAQGCDVMVRHEFRRRGVLRELLRSFLASDHGCDVRVNYPNRVAVRLIPRYAGGEVIGRLPKWVRPLGASAELGAAGVAVGVLGALWGRAIAPRSAPQAVAPLDRLDDKVDRLARESAAFARCVRVRDAAYLHWRWRERPGASWTITGVHADGRLTGLAVLGGDRSAAGRRGRIVDLLAADGRSMRSLLVDAVERLAANGCSRVVCELADPRPWARWELLRCGFLPFRGDIPIIARSLSSAAGSAPERLDGWFMTRGDTDLA